MQAGDDCIDGFDPCNFICGKLKCPTIARRKAEYPKHQMLCRPIYVFHAQRWRESVQPLIILAAVMRLYIHLVKLIMLICFYMLYPFLCCA